MFKRLKSIVNKRRKGPKKRILVVSLQKCGTHLIKKVLAEAGLNAVGINECGMSDFHRLYEGQYFLSHFCPSDDVHVAIEAGNDDIRVIFNFRDPRDVLVSWFYWMHSVHGGSIHLHQEYMRKVYSNIPDDELMDIFIRNEKFRKIEINPIEQFRHNRVMYFHPKVHNVRFEDLIGETGGGDQESQVATIRGIFNFLGIVNIDIEQVAERAFDTASPTFRKGRSGGYRDVLSEVQLALFNELHGDVLRHYGYF